MKKVIDERELIKSSIDELLQLLNRSSDIKTKHLVAKELGNRNDSSVVEPLVIEIKKESNQGYLGTFVFVCEQFDCSEYLDLFLELIAFGEYEVSMTSVMVLENMKTLKKEQLEKANLFLEGILDDNSENEEHIEEALEILSTLG